MLKIGILDSGMGGHYALLQIKSHFPQYEYEVYLDHKNAPYGNKSGEEIYLLAEIGCKQLWDKGCNLILIACNTICAEILKQLQDSHMDKKILGCIVPSVELAIEVSENCIGIIGTQFTIDSKKYEHEMKKLSPKHILHVLATPELAGFIERGLSHNEDTLKYLNKHIDELLKKGIDTLILACTHYSIFYEYLNTNYPELKIIDSAKTQTVKLGEYLQRHKELAM